MNIRLVDGTVRCPDHLDSANHQGLTTDPCTYCGCAWTPEACHASQARHGRVDDCTDHPYTHPAPVEHVPTGVSLAKTYNGASMDDQGLAYPPVPRHPNPVPWHPLHDHRQGLRANDLVVLHSALVVISYHGGTAH